VYNDKGIGTHMMIRLRPWLLHMAYLLLSVCAMHHPCQALTVTLTPTSATSISSAYSVSLGNPTGGAYTIGFAGQTTAAIPYNAPPSAVQAAIASLSTVGAGNATVSGNSDAWTVTLADSIVNASHPLTLTSSLTGGSTAVITPLINQQNAWLTSSNSPNPNFLFNNNYPVQAGGQSPTSSGVYGYANAAALDGPIGFIAADFNANSSQVEIIVKGGQGTMRILVDGVVVFNSSSTVSTVSGILYPTNNSQHNIMLDFGGVRATRRIRVECSFCVLCGASVGVNDTITQAAPTTNARCFVLGESFTQGYKGTTFMTGWDYQIGWHFNWDVWSLGQGGTGYIRAGTGGNMDYADRVLPPSNAWVADIGYSTSGSYTLTYAYGGVEETTAPIKYNDSLTTIQSDLEALSNIGAGNVEVHGNAGGMVNAQIIILFRNALSAQAGTVTMNAAGLSPNSSGKAGVLHWYGDIAPFVPRNASGQALPFYIVIACGRSDAIYTLSAIQSAAAALWTGLRAAYPTATIMLVGPWSSGSNQPPIYGQISNALEAQAAITLPPINGQTPFVNLQGTITGTGNEGAPANNGNADIYIASDGVHPTDAGHTYIAQLVSKQFQRLLNGAQPWIPDPAASSLNPVTSTSVPVSVLGADTDGESNLTYTWSAMGPGSVSFSPNGTNAAQNSTATFTAAGCYTITAQVTDTALKTQSNSFCVTVDAPPSSIAISPPSWTTFTYPASQAFTATADDQFGNPIVSQPPFTWGLLSGSVGTISTSGASTVTQNELLCVLSAVSVTCAVIWYVHNSQR